MTDTRLLDLSSLTENQLLFWIGYKLQPDVPLETHAIRFTFTIEDAIDPDHFQRAVQKLVDAADALRTVVRDLDLVPQRTVAQVLRSQVEVVHLAGEPDPDAALRAWVDVRRARPVSAEAPFECALLALGPKRVVWYLALHHVVGDARSVLLITQHVAKCYELSLEGKLDQAPPLPTFEDYTAYERAHRKSPRYKQSAAYWEKKMLGARRISVPAIQSPAGEATSGAERIKRSYNTKESVRTERVSLPLGADRSAALQSFTAREGFFSPAVPLATLLFTYLARLSDEFDVALKTGTMFANRPEQFMGTIGLFVSTCMLQVHLEEDDTLFSLARKTQAELVRTSIHQSNPVQNPIHRKVFDTMFNYFSVQFGHFAGRPMRAERIPCGHSNYPLSLSVSDFDATGHFMLEFDFQCAAFPRERQRETVSYFETVLDRMLEDPHEAVGRLL